MAYKLKWIKVLALFMFKQQGNMLHYISDPRKNITMFAPSVSAISQLSDDDRKYWTNSTERLQYLIRYIYTKEGRLSRNCISRQFGFINWAVIINWPQWRVSKLDVSSVSPSRELIIARYDAILDQSECASL